MHIELQATRAQLAELMFIILQSDRLSIECDIIRLYQTVSGCITLYQAESGCSLQDHNLTTYETLRFKNGPKSLQIKLSYWHEGVQLSGSSGHFDMSYMTVAQFVTNNLRWKLSDYYVYYKNSESLIAINAE